MKLYYFPPSPYAQKTLIAIDEKGAQVERELVDLANAESRAAFEKVNPFGKVPFLRDEARDRSVLESSTIIEYLDRHLDGGARLVPGDPELAAQARFYDRIFDWYVAEPALKIFFDSRRAADQHDILGVEAAQKRLDKSYALLDRHLSARQWVSGEPFSMGDIAGAAALGMARRMRPFEAHQNVSAYFARLAARPSVARAFTEAQAFLAGRARA